MFYTVSAPLRRAAARLALACAIFLGGLPGRSAETDRVVIFGIQMRTNVAGPANDSNIGAYTRDLVEVVARAAGLRYKIVEFDLYPPLLAAFERGEVDVIPFVTRVPERETRMSFTVPHFRATYMAFARAGTTVPSHIEKIGEGRIVVIDQSPAHFYLRRQPWASHVTTAADVYRAMEELHRNRADYFINNSLIGAFRIREAGLTNRIVPLIAVPGETSDVCMAVRPDDRNLLARLNDGLLVAEQNSELRRVYEQWNPLFESHWLPRAPIQRWAAALAALAAIGWLSYLWRLRRAQRRAEAVERIVEARTRELATANDHLRASETQFRIIWENAFDGMRLTDESGTVRRVNAAYCRLMELPREQLEGRSFAQPYPAESRAHILAKFHERFRSRTIQSQQTSTVTLDTGRVLHVEVSNSFLELPGEPPLLLSVFRDVSARKRAEEEHAQLQTRLFQSQKQEALGVLAGGVAHDFNNILAAMLNYTALAQADCPPTHPQVREFLGEVLTSGRRAAELVRQILIFTRAEETERTPLLLQAVVRDALALLRSTLPASVAIESDLDPAAPTILANANQLHQIVMNLGINAAHAMAGREGLLTVKLRPRTVDAALARSLSGLAPGDYLCLEVTDNGCGMEPAVQARIFEPFFTTKPVGQGTGLGLAVVQSIVLNHGGAIAVRSRPGAGTTFTIFLPAPAEVIAAAPRWQPPSSAASVSTSSWSPTRRTSSAP